MNYFVCWKQTVFSWIDKFVSCLSQESEPISNYLCSEMPKEVKQRIARMGVEAILKMVRLPSSFYEL